MFNRKKKRIAELEQETKDLEREKEYYRKRLRRAGNAPYVYADSPDIRTFEFEEKGIRYGTYSIFSPESFTDDMIEQAKEQLVQKIARCLIDNDIVQFVVHTPDGFDPLNQRGTVGVKLRVLPWELSTLMIRQQEKG